MHACDSCRANVAVCQETARNKPCFPRRPPRSLTDIRFVSYISQKSYLLQYQLLDYLELSFNTKNHHVLHPALSLSPLLSCPAFIISDRLMDSRLHHCHMTVIAYAIELISIVWTCHFRFLFLSFFFFLNYFMYIEQIISILI